MQFIGVFLSVLEKWIFFVCFSKKAINLQKKVKKFWESLVLFGAYILVYFWSQFLSKTLKILFYIYIYKKVAFNVFNKVSRFYSNEIELHVCTNF